MSHFEYVQPEDLEKIGMGKPGIRRLLDAVKKKKTQLWKRNLFTKLMPATGKQQSNTSSRREFPETNLTCLIQEKDVR